MTKHIIVNDKIYGKHTINEPVLIDLLRSKSVQRLKKINQFGIPDKYYFVKNFTRYEHSVGVMILLKQLGASLEEQVAGLLHDISHTAFSHVYDWVIGEAGDETYQDAQTKNSINSGEIGSILKKHGFKPAMIANHERFKLLEKGIPEICADRIDYSLREFSLKNAKYLSKSLIKIKGGIAFKDKRSAYLFATAFLKLQKNHWGGYEAVSRYKFFSTILKQALKERTINLQDFLKDDEYVVSKLLRTKNKKIVAALKVLEREKMPKSKNYEMVMKKFRHTDPEFINEGNIFRLSQAEPKFKAYLEKQRIYNKKGTKVPILSI